MKNAALRAVPVELAPRPANRLSIFNHLAVAPILAVVVLTLCVGVIFSLDTASMRAAIQEGGPVESATAVALLLACFGLAALARRDRTFVLLAAFAIGLIAAREFDLHKAFSSDGVLKTRYYTNPEIPQVEKILVLLVLGVLLAGLIAFAHIAWRRMLVGLREGVPSAWSVAAGLGAFAAGKALDAATRLLEPLGVTLADASVSRQLFEETLELTGAVLLLCAVVQYAIGRRSAPPERTESRNPLAT